MCADDIQNKSIFLGKGRDLQEHPGNIYFRSFVEAFSEQYETVGKQDKRHVITGVMRLLEMDGYVFLKWVKEGEEEGAPKSTDDKDDWVSAEEEEIYSKIGHAFRACRKGQFKSRTGGKADVAVDRAIEHKMAIYEALRMRDETKNASKGQFPQQRLKVPLEDSAGKAAPVTNQSQGQLLQMLSRLQARQNFESGGMQMPVVPAFYQPFRPTISRIDREVLRLARDTWDGKMGGGTK